MEVGAAKGRRTFVLVQYSDDKTYTKKERSQNDTV